MKTRFHNEADRPLKWSILSKKIEKKKINHVKKVEIWSHLRVKMQSPWQR